MGFRNDAYATVWAVENKGNYSVVELSTSHKNKQTDKYETDFSSKFVRFIGTAHEKAANLSPKDRIKLGNVETTISKSSENKYFTNFLVYSFDKADEAHQKSDSENTDVLVSEDDEELPF